MSKFQEYQRSYEEKYQTKNLKEWYELYSDFSLFLQPIIKSILKNKWKTIFNRQTQFETTEIWKDFSNQIRKITDHKEQFLSAVSYVVLGISTDGEIKTIRPCFPINLNDFKKTFFPNLNDAHYLMAQFALVEMSYEAFIGKYHRSLTSEVIEGGQPRYFQNLQQVRNEGRSVRTDVDEIVGFNCLVYIPIIPGKLWLLFFSPIDKWFPNDADKMLTKILNKLLGQNLKLIELYWDAIQFLEEKIKEMWLISFNRAIDILYHPFSAKVQDEEKRKFFYDVVKSYGLDILSHVRSPKIKEFDLRETSEAIIRNDNQLRAVIEDDLDFDLKRLPDESVWVRGDPTTLSLAIWEVVHNARKYGKHTEITFKNEDQLASISFKSKISKPILVKDYMQLRFGVPLTNFEESKGLGLWLVNKLLTAMGGYLKVELIKSASPEALEVQLCFEKV